MNPVFLVRANTNMESMKVPDAKAQKRSQDSQTAENQEETREARNEPKPRSGKKGKRRRDRQSEERLGKRRKSESQNTRAEGAKVTQAVQPMGLLEEKVPGNQNDLVPILIRVRSKRKPMIFDEFIKDLTRQAEAQDQMEPKQDANLASRKRFIIISSRLLRKALIEVPGYVEPYKEADFIREGKELTITKCDARGFKMFEALCHTMERLIVDEVSLCDFGKFEGEAPKRVQGVPYFKVVLYSQIVLKNFDLLKTHHLVSKRDIYLPIWLRNAFEEARKRGYTRIKMEERRIKSVWLIAYMGRVTFDTHEQGWEKNQLMRQCSWVRNKRKIKPSDLGLVCTTEECLHWAPKKGFSKRAGQTSKVRFGPNILAEVTKYLNKEDLDQFRLVCRDWHRMARYTRCYLRTKQDVDDLIEELKRSRGLKGIQLWINYWIVAAGLNKLWFAVVRSGIVVVRMASQEIAYRIARPILEPKVKVIYKRELFLDTEEVKRVKLEQITYEEIKQRRLIEIGIKAVVDTFKQFGVNLED